MQILPSYSPQFYSGPSNSMNTQHTHIHKISDLLKKLKESCHLLLKTFDDFQLQVEKSPTYKET